MPGRQVVYVGKNLVAEYKGSLSGFQACALGPELLASCMEHATNHGLPYAVQISPVHDGEYKRSWRVRPGIAEIEGGPETIPRRVAALLVNIAPHSALVEWGGAPGGGRRHLAQHICQRVLDRLGGLDGGTDADLQG